MNSTPEENFIAFNSFKGLGNPDSKLWFVGLEEGGDSISNDNIEEQVKECYRFPCFVPPEKIKLYKTQVWDYISKFLIQYLNIKDKDWSSYREIMFSETDSQFFLTELFPLPKKSFKHWANEYGELFGFSFSDKKKYINEVITNRFPMLFNLWKEKNPDLTICFGKTGWKYFIELFRLDCINYGEKFKIDKTKNVILIPFLGQGQITNDDIQKLAINLKSV